MTIANVIRRVDCARVPRGAGRRTGRGRLPYGGWLGVLVGLLSGGVPARVSGAAAAPERTPVRHVLVVENTRNMDRQREKGADLVSRLILQGFGQRAMPGDTVELWLLDEQLHGDAFESLTWDRVGAAERSNEAYRLLRELRPKAKRAVMDNLVPTLGLTNSTAGPTVAYLVTSGVDSLTGTPYDEEVNTIFFTHRESLRKARIPFVTVLVARDGAWVGHAVTPGDRQPYIPPFPRPKPAAAQKNAAPATSSGAPSEARKPRPQTVEEIFRQIQQ